MSRGKLGLGAAVVLAVSTLTPNPAGAATAESASATPAADSTTAAAAPARYESKAKGKLRFTIKGLPKGTDSDLRVTGPGGYRSSITANSSYTEKGLRPGTYRVRARTAFDPQTGLGYEAKKSSKRQTVKVRSGQTAKVTVSYRLGDGGDPAGALVVTTGDCGANPGTMTWAIDEANKTPGVDTIWIRPGLKINMAGSGGICGLVANGASGTSGQYKYLITESVDIKGNGSTFQGNQKWVLPDGSLLEKACPRTVGGIATNVAISWALMRIGGLNQNNSAISVTIDGIDVNNVPQLFDVAGGASLSVTKSHFTKIHNYFAGCDGATIGVGAGSTLSMSDSTLSNFWVDPDSPDSNVIANSGTANLDRVRAEDFTTRVLRNVGSSSVGNVVSSQIRDGGGFRNGGTLNIVNTAWETPYFASNDARLQLQQVGGKTVVEGSTINAYDPECSQLECYFSSPGQARVMPLNVFGGALELRGSAVRSVEPYNFAATSAVLVVRAGASATADPYTWVMPRPAQDAAALKALLPGVRTDDPAYDQSQLGWPGTVTPTLGAGATPGVLIDVIPDGCAANALINPITKAKITVDVFGNPRCDDNGRRNIGAVQISEAPHLAIDKAEQRSVTVSWSRPKDPPSGAITGYRLGYRVKGAGNYTFVDVSGPDTLSRTVTGLIPSTEYEFIVAAVNKIGEGPSSNVASATTLGVPFLSYGNGTGVVGTQFAPLVPTHHDLNEPINYVLTGGSLPAGLSLNGSTGRITGTPSAGGKFTLQVTGYGANNTKAVAGFTITIDSRVAPSAKPTLAYPDGQGQRGKSLVPLVPQVTGLSGSPTYSLVGGRLPKGVALNTRTGEISGSPSQAGVFSFTIKVEGKGGSATDKSTLTILRSGTSAAGAKPRLTGVSPNKGPKSGGTVIRLKGSGFERGMVVAVGAKKCRNLKVLSASRAKCSTPSGKVGARKVSVLTTGGKSNTRTFTYVKPPQPRTVDPSVAPLSGGTRIVITGRNLGNGTTIKVGARNCTDVKVWSGGSKASCVVPPGAKVGQVPITVKTDGGSNNQLRFRYASGGVCAQSVEPERRIRAC